MKLILLANIITCLCALIGFIYGINKFFQPKKAVYAQMVTLAAGCMAFGRLYQVVRILTQGDILNGFQLGVLGIIGSLLFFFSAGFGLMDSLADDGTKKYAKYRLISLAAPCVAAIIYVVFIAFADISVFEKIMGAVITAFAMATSYFNLKHIIFPDVDFGVIKCLKQYNALVLVYSYLCIFEFVAISRDSNIFIFITGVLMGVILLLIVPTVERGIKKWTA